MRPPLAIDLFAGLGGWADGLLALGYRVVGYDIEAHEYGEERYQGELVIQDVLTIHGSAFKDAVLIVASPPCQFFSYTAMPWSRAKALAAEVRADPERLAKELALFNACFRIQREASEAAGRHILMVVENVRGAIPWVGRSRGSFGSFHLWGDVPALMPSPAARNATKVPSFRFDGSGGSFQTASVRRTDVGKGACGIEATGLKRPGINLSEVGFNVSMAREVAVKLKGASYTRTAEDKRQHIGISRKAASAMIAKIPEPLSRHIGTVYWPEDLPRIAAAEAIAQRSEKRHDRAQPQQPQKDKLTWPIKLGN